MAAPHAPLAPPGPAVADVPDAARWPWVTSRPEPPGSPGPPGPPGPPSGTHGGRPPGGGDAALAGAAIGRATPNATYLGQRLLYEKVPEASFDPLTNSRFLVQLAKQALLFWIIFFVGGALAAVFFLILGVSGVGLAAFNLWYICALLSSIALGLLFWLLPLPALLSEWKYLLDDKGAVGPMTFEHITFALQRRQTPLEAVQVRRLRLPGGEIRDYLEIRQGIFTGFISCFAHGQDLYVGWTFWLRLSPLRWLLMALARIWQNITQRGTDLYLTLRYESAKAMREAMHSAAREGIDVAVGELTPQGQGIVAAIPVAVTEINS